MNRSCDTNLLTNYDLGNSNVKERPGQDKIRNMGIEYTRIKVILISIFRVDLQGGCLMEEKMTIILREKRDGEEGIMACCNV